MDGTLVLSVQIHTIISFLLRLGLVYLEFSSSTMFLFHGTSPIIFSLLVSLDTNSLSSLKVESNLIGREGR